MAHDLADQRLLDAKDDVAVEVRIAGREDVGRHRLVAVCGDHKVHVGRAHQRPAHRPDQLTDRTILRNRVRDRFDGPEPESAVGVGGESASSLGFGQVRALDVVQAVAVGLPDVEDGAGDGVAAWSGQCPR